MQYCGNMYTFLTCSNESLSDQTSNEPSEEERLPEITWCRDPFIEQLNEIEAMDGIKH